MYRYIIMIDSETTYVASYMCISYGLMHYGSNVATVHIHMQTDIY